MLTALRLGLGFVHQCGHTGLRSRNSLLTRWIRDEGGQDLIEYALLCSAIGFAGAVAFSFISDAMFTTYTTWDDAVQSEDLVEVADPVTTP